MARLQRLNGIPKEFGNDSFPVWMFWCRAVQLLLAVLVLALDAYLISLKSLVGTPTFSGLAMFTSIFTLLLIAYFVIAPKYATNFYHVYIEAGLEFLLTVFWLASFAGLANWVGTLDYYGGAEVLINGSTSCHYDKNFNRICKTSNDGKRAAATAKAVVAFGAFLFALCLANFIFIVVYVIRLRQSRRADGEAPAAYTGTAGGPSSVAPTATTTTDPEMGQHKEPMVQTTSPQPVYYQNAGYQPQHQAPSMPPGFAGNEGSPAPPPGVAEVPGQRT